MDIKQLRFFVTVAHCENVNRAADRLNIAQSALSRQIQSLEYELRIQLFERKGKRIKLSESGAIFLEEAQAVLDQIDIAQNKARMLSQGAIGRLRIGFHQIAGRHSIVPQTCHLFRREHSGIQLEFAPLRSQEQAFKLRRGEIDVAICHNIRNNNSENVLPILVDSWVLAMPDNHRLAHYDEIFLSDLVEERFVTISTKSAPLHIDQLEEELSRRGFVPNGVQEVHEEAMLLDFISFGMGIGFVMDAGCRPPNVVMRRVTDFKLYNELCLIWHPDNTNPFLPRFVDFFRKLVEVTPADSAPESEPAPRKGFAG